MYKIYIYIFFNLFGSTDFIKIANRESSTEKDHEQCQHLTSDTKTGRKKECIGLDSDLLQLHLKELQQLSWCSNILRETMRLYPVAPFLTRLLAKESVIGGYHIPANVRQEL